MLDAGADKVSINSAALARPALIDELAQVFGAQCVVLAIDAKKRPDGSYEAYVAGGRTPTGQRRGRSGRARASSAARGRSCSRAWTATAPRTATSWTLTRAIAAAVDVPVIASGGVGEPQHLVEGLQAGADAVLAASIFHYGTHTIAEVKAAIAAAGFPMRPTASAA